MRFGYIFFGRDLGRVGALARLGEEQGFDLVGLCDSPSLCYDPFIALTLAAQNTSRVRLGTGVSNAQTRHPLILANLTAALSQLAPGRIFLGLGTGNSGVRHAGAPPASLEKLGEAVQEIRALLDGQRVPVPGGTMTVHGAPSHVPICIAGSGPKALRLAGRLADIAWVNVGLSPEVVQDGMRWVREGAEAAGRNPNEVETWVFGIGAIAQDRAQALDEAKGAATAIAAYILRGDARAKHIPPSVEAKISQLLAEYQYSEHLTPGHSANYHLADRLGIADFVLERMAIAGDPDDCRRQIETIRQAGAENLCFSFSAGPDTAAYIRGFGEQVLPAFSGA
ncbi:MAG: LLM class flavin-dependent oxidoreductase [Chloroflexi bacterium]|nr:LLM class flavin-dependent oxidoreductase [Chloroflexota bacterium]